MDTEQESSELVGQEAPCEPKQSWETPMLRIMNTRDTSSGTTFFLDENTSYVALNS